MVAEGMYTWPEMLAAAYEIGFMRGRARRARDMIAVEAARDTFDRVLSEVPAAWWEAAADRHNAGITAGEDSWGMR